MLKNVLIPTFYFRFQPARLLALALLLLLGRSASAQWTLQPFTFDTPDAFAYRFGVVNASVVWALGYDEDATNRSVALTTTGGQSWQLRPVAGLVAEELITGLSATSTTSAWICTASNAAPGGRVLHTTDGGLTWAPQGGTQFATSRPNFVHFFTANDGVAMGDPLNPPADPFDIFVTHNGGTTWSRAASVPVPLPNENGVVLAPAVVGNTIWFATDESRVFRSTDQGNTWTAAVANTTVSEMYALAFQDELHGLTLSVNDATRTLYAHATVDGGLSWQRIFYAGPLLSGGITGVPGTGLLVSVGAGTLGAADLGSSYSADNGFTWTPIETTREHTSVAAFGAGAVWSGALQGSKALGVYRLNATVLSRRPAAALPALQAYPNPGSGTFRLPLPASAATVRVTDALGREVLRRATPAGRPELLLDLRGQAPGLYLLTLETTAGTARQQLVVQ
ncbi:Por secretion system C-terminal sorting domain-containing protein [Hymenobacter daecheongensis DSM 21074]|uniref:Por secretion system C-terminal sorting domain-containing protein n=1 Tax=Hymenobacter daecheongensis DSM 21074 TaxID=1121955 RepID=A0A1M6EWL4_9BACT|nr:T9SS type A sorting domain-containing protein [Hymenobacter daecheongensis]SHI89769.1 Por secretion system C-terminal sorting domain-containing protein [Hymenobacter daecheongensis DSM 21074]